MGNIQAYQVTALIAVLTLGSTIYLGVKPGIKRMYKYLPIAALLVLSFLFCAIMTVVNYGSYISILYVMVYLVVSPGLILSLLTAGSIDLIRRYKK